jgi:serine/threonine protein kinase
MIRFTRKGKHETYYTYSISKNDIPSEYVIDEKNILGIGNFGVVYSGTRIPENDPIAIKLIPLEVLIPDEIYLGYTTDGFGNICEIEDFEKEVEVSKILGEMNITPKIYFSKIVPLIHFQKPDNKLALKAPKWIGLIIMEQYGISLEKYIMDDMDLFRQNEKMILEQIRKYISQIEPIKENLSINVISDMHYGNILIDKDTNKIKLLDLFYPRLSEEEKSITFEETINLFETKWKDALTFIDSVEKIKEVFEPKT